ncbi:MAG: zinc ribbon domain-containing protein, partial [Deltaproteobacteria bacterium]|nr:zinc ribbon domain-containing protein [Deltaproteobacteria bacterium]
MPIYEYECPKCGIFEVVQKASDKPLKAKPECDQKNCPKKAQRLISPS